MDDHLAEALEKLIAIRRREMDRVARCLYGGRA
jgi:hypothetical protein